MVRKVEKKCTNSSCIAINYEIFRELYSIDLQRGSEESRVDDNPDNDPIGAIGAPPRAEVLMLHFPISQTRHLFPVAVPSGINAFLYSDLRTFRSVSSPWYIMILPYSIPLGPWNKKISNIEGVLKKKIFQKRRPTVQQSNKRKGFFKM